MRARLLASSLASLFVCGLILPTLGSSACGTDEQCNSDYQALLQVPVTLHPGDSTKDKSAAQFDLKTDAVPAPATKQKMLSTDPGVDVDDEVDTAPRPWVSCLLFFAFFFGTLLIMVVILHMLQFIIRWQQRLQEEYLAGLDVAAAAKDATKGTAAGKSSAPEPDEVQTSKIEVGTYCNGDHTRLHALLDIANSADPNAKVQDLVTKAAKAAKLRLSPAAVKETVTGLMALATAAKEGQPKHSGDWNAKDKLKGVFRQVLLMVKVSRAFRLPSMVKRSEEQAWTCTKKQTDHHSDKYADGEKRANAQGGFKDVRLTKSAWQTYFASESWLDHFAIGFVFLYSQTCGLVYALYLKQRFPKMYEFMGPWVLVSRGEAMSIIVLTVMMVLMLTRGFMTGCRKYVGWSTVLQTMADKHVLIHRCIGMMLVFCAILHVIGHLLGSIPAIIGETDTHKINQAFTFGTKMKFNFNTWGGAMRSLPAVTGIILLCLLCCFWALSNEKVRRYSFELFHYPHMLLVMLWCGTLIAHGSKQWLGLGVPLGAIAVLPVVLLYATERIYHIYSGKHETIQISHAIVKKRTVLLEVDTGTSGYAYSTGMYCMLNCPEISELQWHPFTIASGGGERTFQVLFAVVGDWTTKLSELITEAQKSGKSPPPYPKINVRGGYGAPAEGMKDNKHIVMVGGGVGATPFLSFLSNICNSAKLGVKDQFGGIESAVFYWVSREPDDFLWVNQYAGMIAANPKLKERVQIRLCLTRALDTIANEDCNATEVALFWLGVQIALSKFESKALGSELGAPTQFGRPNWKKEFGSHAKALAKKHGGNKDAPLQIAVFACGNPMLVASLEEACGDVTDATMQVRLFAEEF